MTDRCWSSSNSVGNGACHAVAADVQQVRQNDDRGGDNRSRRHLDRPDCAAKARRHHRAPRDGPAGSHVQEIRTPQSADGSPHRPGLGFNESVTGSRRIAIRRTSTPRRRQRVGKWSESQLNLRPPRPEEGKASSTACSRVRQSQTSSFPSTFECRKAVPKTVPRRGADGRPPGATTRRRASRIPGCARSKGPGARFTAPCAASAASMRARLRQGRRRGRGARKSSTRPFFPICRLSVSRQGTSKSTTVQQIRQRSQVRVRATAEIVCKYQTCAHAWRVQPMRRRKVQSQPL